MTGRRRRNKRRDRDDHIDLSVMSPQERRMYKKRMKRIREGKKKRRRAVILWGALFICLVVFVVTRKDKLPDVSQVTSSIKENANGLMSVGGAGFDSVDDGASLSDNSAQARAVADAPVDPDFSAYKGKVDLPPNSAAGTPLDVMRGQAGVDLSTLSEDERAFSAKAAMMTNSYFAGTVQTVNSYLQNYGEGKWHALRSVTGDICVFYDGERSERKVYEGNDGTIESVEKIPFKIVFTMYEDGSFVVTDASENGSSVEDMESYLKGIVSDVYESSPVATPVETPVEVPVETSVEVPVGASDEIPDTAPAETAGE